MKRIKLLGIIGIIISLLTIAACSSNEAYDTAKSESAKEVQVTFNESIEEGFGGRDYDVATTSDDKADVESPMEDRGENQEKALGEEPKLIVTRHYNIETLTYEEGIKFIEEKVRQLNGYIERSEIQGGSMRDNYGYRSAYFKLRIPKGMEDEFVKSLGDIGVITNKTEEAEDITLAYFDMESRLHSKEVQYERLLSILEDADDLEAIIKLEQELAEVTYAIDSMTSQLKRWDNLIDYTTIYVNLNEVQEVTEVVYNPNLGDKIVKTFKESIGALNSIMEGLLLFAIAAIPFVIILGILAVIILPLIKKHTKKRNLKRLNHDKHEGDKE